MIDAITGVGGGTQSVGQIGGMAPSTPVSAPKMAPAVSGAEAASRPDHDFASLLGNAITEFGQKMREAEAVSIGGVKGTASLQDVVEHVMSAEQSLQAVIAVRDKVISAYQEISRMAI
jgi:flagellar hook-basal body complex protein FliE